jgi:hypothetical protein
MKAFIKGMMEFRSMVTTHYDYPEIEQYDAGRELAHKLTFRKWDK